MGLGRGMGRCYGMFKSEGQAIIAGCASVTAIGALLTTRVRVHRRPDPSHLHAGVAEGDGQVPCGAEPGPDLEHVRRQFGGYRAAEERRDTRRAMFYLSGGLCVCGV